MPGLAVCPDNKTDLSAFTDYGNLQGMIADLRYASAKRNATGQPFFLNYVTESLLNRPNS